MESAVQYSAGRRWFSHRSLLLSNLSRVPNGAVRGTYPQSGQYQRQQPDYSNQVETVERWRKTDDNTIEADVTIYDPPALVKPWHVVQHYVRVTMPGLRIRSWVCEENANNQVVQTKEGASTSGPAPMRSRTNKTEN
jgi:hypothetical protein